MSQIIKSTIYARVKGVNTSDNMLNISCETANKVIMNIKTQDKTKVIEPNFIYKFQIAQNDNSDRPVAYLMESTKISDICDLEEVDRVYRRFDNRNPLSLDEMVSTIYSYIEKIENNVLHDITKNLIDRYKDKFFVYPAATKLHHAYIGGLAYHTIGMLKMVDTYVENYSYLNKDYLYSGVILHDLGKIIEFSGVENTEYKLEGQFLGHLVIGTYFVTDEAKRLGYENTEEALLLEHMIISHHGQPNFGAAKRPQTAEALVLWYLDTIDSKLRVLGEQFELTKTGEFTDTIGVLDKVKFYKHK